MNLFLLLVALLPWLTLVGLTAFLVRIPRELPPAPKPHSSDLPSLSVVVPARNEAGSIESCVRSLTASRYPDFEVVVVDDRSDDGTAALVRALPRGGARQVRVVTGEPLPEGWLGKPWACQQGAEAAEGEVLLFTDADTVHGPELLARSVRALHEEEADLLTVAGRQILGSFWERLVQPQIFYTMVVRFWNVEAWIREGRWREAIANGQYMMFPRDAYRALGGHQAVKDEVVEDLAMAQHTVRSGRRLQIRTAEDDLGTRMYTSLGELARGWGKNLHVGGLQSFPRRLRPLLPFFSTLGSIYLWVLPPLVLAAGLSGWLGPAASVGPALLGDGSGWTGLLYAWAGLVVTLSLGLWAVVYGRMDAGVRYALLYPVGAAVTTWIYVRSWQGGLDVEWKGRSYRLKELTD